MRYRKLIILFCLFFLSVGFSARAYYSPGKPTGFINDYANVLSAQDKSSLEAKLVQFDKDSSNQISVVTINSLQGDTIENFAVKLFDEWKIGQAKKDNGILLLIAVNDHLMKIEVGYGLEGALTDAISGQIIRNTLTPAFRANDYYSGLNQATNQIIAVTKGEYQPAATDTTSGGKMNIPGDAWFYLIFFGFYLLSVLRRYLAKSRNWWEGGAIGIILGLIIVALFLRTLIYLIVLPVTLAILGLVFDYLVSRIFPQPKPRGKGRGGFWFFGGSGGFGGSGSGGGGFGGFGGGGSGGGGASGGW